jgi:hypothetical protein
MSAFGGKANNDQPLLTNLDLGVHDLARHLRFQADYDDGSADGEMKLIELERQIEALSGRKVITLTAKKVT